MDRIRISSIVFAAVLLALPRVAATQDRPAPAVDLQAGWIGFADDGIVSEAVIGMKVGETKNATVPPEKAYGAYNLTYIQPVNMSELTAANITPYVNQTLSTLFGTVRVDSIDEANNTVYIDYNHRLAGQTLKFTITLVNIE